MDPCTTCGGKGIVAVPPDSPRGVTLCPVCRHICEDCGGQTKGSRRRCDACQAKMRTAPVPLGVLVERDR